MTKMSFLSNQTALFGLAASDVAPQIQATLSASPTPNWQAGPPGTTYLLTLETTRYALGIGGDIGTAKGGDTGGYNKDYSNITVATGNADIAKVAQPWLGTVNTDVNNDNLQAATNTLFNNTNQVFTEDVSASTSDIGQGFTDLGNGLVASAAAVAGAVGAAAGMASGNPLGIIAGIGSAAGAISATETATKDFSTPAAQDAIADIVNTLGDWLSDYDTYWTDAWEDAVHAGVPGAAAVFTQEAHSTTIGIAAHVHG